MLPMSASPEISSCSVAAEPEIEQEFRLDADLGVQAGAFAGVE